MLFRSYLTIYAVAFQDTAFRTAAAQAWNNSFLAGESGELLAFLRALAGELRASAIMDRIRWKIGDAQTAGSDFDAAVKTVLTFIKERVKTLNGAFSAPVAMLYYDANGGEGVMFHTQILSVGETATLNGAAPRAGTQTELISSVFNGTAPFVNVECLISPPKGYTFTGWNTAPDGSGDTYQPGDGFVLAEKTNVLYAQWKKK